jgi:uncharacterized hydrophobic protein (TIGR00271 family)
MMPKASPEDLDNLRQNLSQESQLDLNFLILTLSSCVIATLGLLINSAAVIIGAMIIAPLILPLRGIALAAIEADWELLQQSLTTLGLGSLFSVVIAWILGRLFGLPASEFGSEILARTQPNLADLGVAIAAGVVSGFAKLRPQLNDALAGTAIAVALMPPLCVIGITLAQGMWLESGGAFFLYLTNLLGITVACILVFAWGGYYLDANKMRQVLRWSTAMIALLVVPLFFSLFILIRKKHLEATIEDILVSQTITIGQQAEVIDFRVQWEFNPWSKNPSIITVILRAKELITAKQVREVEDFLYRRLQQRFRVVLQVIQFQEISSDEADSSVPSKSN